MRFIHTRSALAIAAVAMPVFTATAFAQSPAAPAPAVTQPPAAATPSPEAGGKHTMPTAAQINGRVEQHIAQQKAEFHITAAQEPQWEQFAQVMRDNSRDISRSFEQRGSRLSSMNAAENMQSYADMAQQHAQDMQKLAAAFQTLYSSLSDDQKKAADIMFRQRPERGHAASHAG
jgi:small-conductance mechanosensitive channel